MNVDSSEIAAPFVKFDPNTWASFKHEDEKLTITENELQKFMAFNDKLSLEDVKKIYLPLSSLLRMYFISRHDRLSVIQKFLGFPMDSVPFIISISGSVSVGKTTTAKLLFELIKQVFIFWGVCDVTYHIGGLPGGDLGFFFSH